MKRGYGRVSTQYQKKSGNSLEKQEQDLRAAGAEQIYKDVFTGKKMERPGLDKLLEEVQEGDTIIVTKLDRLGRTLGQASELITQLIDRGIKIEVLGIGVLDNSSVSTLFRNLLLAFAEYEREMIVERTQEGKAIAKQKPGFREGRPRIEKARMDHAMELLVTESYNQVANETGISKSTLIREKKRRDAL